MSIFIHHFIFKIGIIFVIYDKDELLTLMGNLKFKGFWHQSGVVLICIINNYQTSIGRHYLNMGVMGESCHVKAIEIIQSRAISTGNQFLNYALL